jgi:hypothetical protein
MADMEERVRNLEAWRDVKGTEVQMKLEEFEKFRDDMKELVSRVEGHLAVVEDRFRLLDRRLLLLAVSILVLSLIGPDGVVHFIRDMISGAR